MGPTRSTILKILPAAAALSAAVLLLLDLSSAGSIGCATPAAASHTPNLDAVLIELSLSGWIAPGFGRAICVGPIPGGAAAKARQLGFQVTVGDACCGLPFVTSSVDFALALALDRARVPARVVLEMERVLRPGRVGAVVRTLAVRPAGLMSAVAPVASLLRFSDVVGARAVNGSAVVVFRKRAFGSSASRISATCDSGKQVIIMPRMFSEITEFVQAALVTIGVGPSVRSSTSTNSGSQADVA